MHRNWWTYDITRQHLAYQQHWERNQYMGSYLGSSARVMGQLRWAASERFPNYATASAETEAEAHQALETSPNWS